MQGIQQAKQGGIALGQGGTQRIKPGCRARPAQALPLQGAHRIKPGAAFHASAAERMLQDCEQRRRREAIRHHARHQAQKCRCRRIGQGRAGAVISGDAMAREFCRHTPRQIAIRRDQGSALARDLHRFAQQKRNGSGFLLRIGGFKPADACKCALPAPRIAFGPNIQTFCRAKALCQHHGAIRRRAGVIRGIPWARCIGLHAKIGKQLQLPGKGMARRATHGVSQAWRDGFGHALQHQRAIGQVRDAAEQGSRGGNGAARTNAGGNQLFARWCHFQRAALRYQRAHPRQAKIHHALILQPAIPIAHHRLQ